MQINKAAAKLVVIVSATYRSHAVHFAVELISPVKRFISFFRLPARERKSRRDIQHSWRNFKKKRRNSMNMWRKLWPD